MSLSSQKTFLLVHGAWHGAWCWENIETALQKLGYKTIAPDLPGHGKRKEPLAEQTLESYAEDIAQILRAQEEPVILVGHSMGGAVITMAAEKCPEKVSKLVYFAAFLLKPGQSVNGLENGIRPIDLYARSLDGKTAPWGPKQVEGFSRDCSQEDRESLYPRLCSEAIAPLVTGGSQTEERWGQLRRFYIACDDDVAATPEAVQTMLTNYPCEQVHNIHADHLAFYSNPEALVDALVQIAETE